MTQRIPQLAKIPVHRITIREGSEQLTSWDSRVVHSDMVKYISAARVINATPIVEIRQKVIVAVSGIPFIFAASEANPPLETVVCACDCPSQQLRELGLQVVTATELLDELQSSTPFEATGMLFFNNPVEQSKQLEIQNLMAICYDRISNVMIVRDSNFFRSMEWQDDGSILIWKWLFMVLEGSHALILPELVHQIDSDIAKIRSWNGMAL